MDLKKTNAPVNTITYNKNVIEEPTGNVYEAITIIAKRASQINFEILGKVGPNYLVYKKVRWKHMLQVFNKDMVQISNDRMSFLPDKVFNVDFVILLRVY